MNTFDYLGLPRLINIFSGPTEFELVITLRFRFITGCIIQLNVVKYICDVHIKPNYLEN